MRNFHLRVALAVFFLSSLSLAEKHTSFHDPDDGPEGGYSTATPPTPDWAQTVIQNPVVPGQPTRQPANSTPLNAEETLRNLRIEAGRVMSEDIKSSYCIERICRTLKQIQNDIDGVHYDQVFGKSSEERARYFGNLASDELNSLLKYVTARISKITESDEAMKLAVSKKLLSDYSKLKQDIEKAIKPTAEQVAAAKSVLDKNGVTVTAKADGTAEFTFKDSKAFQAKIGVGDPELVKALNTLSPGLGNELARNTLGGEAFNRYVTSPADQLNKGDRAVLARGVADYIKTAERGEIEPGPRSLNAALETLAKAAQFEKNIGKENLTDADRLALAQARGLAYDQIYNNPIVQGNPTAYRAANDRANQLLEEIDASIKGTDVKNQVRAAQATRGAIAEFNQLIVGNERQGQPPLDELIKQASKAAAFYVDPSALKFSRENQYVPVLEARFKALEDTAKGLQARGGDPELVRTLQKTTQNIRNAFVDNQSKAAEEYARDAKNGIISAGVGIATLGTGSVLAGTFRVASGSFALASATQGATGAAAVLTTRQLVTQTGVRLVVGGTAGASINGTLAAASNVARAYDAGKPVSLAEVRKEAVTAAKEGGVAGAGLAVLPRPVQQAAGVYFTSRQTASAIGHGLDRKFASAAVDLVGAYAVPAAIERVSKIGRPKETAYTPEELAALKELVPKIEAQRGKPVDPSEYGSILERGRNLKRYTREEKGLTEPLAHERLNEAGLLFSGKNTDPANQMAPKSDPGKPQSLHRVLSDTLNRLGDLDELASLPYERLVERVGQNVAENYNAPKNPAASEALARAGADYIKSLTPLGDSRFRVVQRGADSGPLTLAEAQNLLSSRIEGGLMSTTVSTTEAVGFYPKAGSNKLVIYEVPKGTKGVLINGAGPVAEAARAEQASRGNLGFAQNEVAVNIRSGSLKVGEIKTITLADGRTAYSVKLVPEAPLLERFTPKTIPVLGQPDGR